MSGPAYLMTLEEKAERRKAIVVLYELGTQPADIAKHFGITANYVRALLREAGWEVTPPAQNKASIWDLEGPALRRAIAQRAADGARQRLNEMGVDA